MPSTPPSPETAGMVARLPRAARMAPSACIGPVALTSGCRGAGGQLTPRGAAIDPSSSGSACITFLGTGGAFCDYRPRTTPWLRHRPGPCSSTAEPRHASPSGNSGASGELHAGVRTCMETMPVGQLIWERYCNDGRARLVGDADACARRRSGPLRRLGPFLSVRDPGAAHTDGVGALLRQNGPLDWATSWCWFRVDHVTTDAVDKPPTDSGSSRRASGSGGPATPPSTPSRPSGLPARPAASACSNAFSLVSAAFFTTPSCARRTTSARGSR